MDDTLTGALLGLLILFVVVSIYTITKAAFDTLCESDCTGHCNQGRDCTCR